MADKLTEKLFWEDYWKSYNNVNVVNLNFPFERCLARELKNKIPLDVKGNTILEIGCAPGKWLIFFAKEFGMIPFGIDYSKEGIEATKRNFYAFGLNVSGLKAVDFLAIKPDKLHDIVISLGFVEHFTNPDEIVKKHLDWLKPGGMLILGVPNFRGIYKLIQRVLSNKILEKHNLEIMCMDYFYSLVEKFDVKLVSSLYLGSFDPCLFIDDNIAPGLIHKVINTLLRAMKKIRQVELFDNLNHKWISSYILATYKK